MRKKRRGGGEEETHLEHASAHEAGRDDAEEDDDSADEAEDIAAVRVADELRKRRNGKGERQGERSFLELLEKLQRW